MPLKRGCSACGRTGESSRGPGHSDSRGHRCQPANRPRLKRPSLRQHQWTMSRPTRRRRPGSILRQVRARPIRTPTRSEDRSRRPALRTVDQRRRRTACAVHCRAARASLSGRGADHVRQRLRDVAERADAGRRAGQRRPGSTFQGGPRARPAALRQTLRAGVRTTSFDWRRARLARRRRSDQSVAGGLHRPNTRPSSTTACSSVTATTTPTTARAPRARGRSWCRPPNVTRPSACRSSSRCSAASAV